MKFFKLFTLILPFFVFADNPIAPVDIDTKESESIEAISSEVENKAIQISGYDTSSIYTSEIPYISNHKCFVLIKNIKKCLDILIYI